MASIVGDCRETCPTCPSIGTFNRLNYDNCAYKKKLGESTSPLMFQLSRYKFENCGRCTYDGAHYAPFDLVSEESELKGLTRPATRCPSRLYTPTCKKSDLCWSTYDKDFPVVYPADLCPVVCNNIKKMKTPGYVLQKREYCGKPLGQNGTNVAPEDDKALRYVQITQNGSPYQNY